MASPYFDPNVIANQIAAGKARQANPTNAGMPAGPSAFNPFAGPPLPGSDLQFGNSANNSRSNFNNTSVGNTNQTSTSATGVTVDPKYGPLLNLVQQMIMKRMNGGVPVGYAEKGIGAINHAHDAVMSAIDNKMASRGLMGTNPHAAAVGADEASRASDIGNFNANLPILSQQLQDAAMGQASNLVGQFGRGSTTSGSQAGATNQSQSGGQSNSGLSSTAGYGLRGADPTALITNQLPGMQMPVLPSTGASAISGIGDYLANLYGQGLFNKKPNAGPMGDGSFLNFP